MPKKFTKSTKALFANIRVEMLRTMVRIRVFESEVHSLYQTGGLKGTAHSSIGQEAIAAGACHALKAQDFILSHHRGHGHCIAKGASMNRMMAELMGKSDGYCGGLGGSMHIADLDLNILGANGIVGASMGLGLGAALTARLKQTDSVGIAFFGDGAANEGIFHEALNAASIWKLPLIFMCENNQYGLSMEASRSIAGGSVAKRAAAYGLPGIQIDGNSDIAVFEAVSDAAERARRGGGPTLLEARTYRWDDHNMRPSWPRYRSDDEESAHRKDDPITRTVSSLKKGHKFTEKRFAEILGSAEDEVKAAIDFAQSSPEPGPDILAYATSTAIRIVNSSAPVASQRKLTYVEAINEALRQEMERDASVFLIGEDIAKIGGIFGATRGLAKKFGDERVIDTPISEQAIAGTAVGAALSGMRPVVEIQIFDFVTHMMDMIVNQAAKLRFMLGGQAKVPVVFRGPQGGGVRLAAQHSQSLEAWFAHVPGLVVLAPSNPYDAKGLLTAAIRDDNPCVFLEHKVLYLGHAQPVPEEPYELPIGRAAIKREGNDITIVAILNMVDRALQAAEELTKKGISAEVIDPRTLRPLDVDTVITSIQKTNRCLIVHEAWRTGGIGAELAAEISERAFDWLDAPVTRLGARDVPMPFSPVLERAVIPSKAEIIAAAASLCGT